MISCLWPSIYLRLYRRRTEPTGAEFALEVFFRQDVAWSDAPIAIGSYVGLTSSSITS
jgi:hypothetical protein